MEECPPDGDYTSGEDDPSESDTPPIICTPNPAVEQAQGSAQSTSERSQLACFVFSRSMTHIWSRFTLQASSDTAWHSSLRLIYPRRVQRRWRITICLPFLKAGEEEGLFHHLRWDTRKYTHHYFMTWHNALFFVAFRRSVVALYLSRIERDLWALYFDVDIFRRTEPGTRGCTTREKDRFYRKEAALAVIRMLEAIINTTISRLRILGRNCESLG